MKKRSPFALALSFLLALAILVPPDAMGQAGQAGQRAGQVSREIPQVSLSRGTQTLPAPEKTLVDWGDIVNTSDGGRARVALDDGSLLNVGSGSHLTVTMHSSATQQTQIELDYGRVRSQVVKQSKPNAKFEIHTAVGVAGVVGTDFFLSYLNNLFQVVVYEGQIKFCNLDNVCVNVGAGQTSTIRDGHQSPSQPTQATPSELTDAANATSVAPGVAFTVPPIHHFPIWAVAGMVAAVAVPAIVVPVVIHGKAPGGGQQLPGNGCVASSC